ncbi:MAG: hypothetical protein M2R45_01509 [Verrucomicrobia subdivision 3 bacterium]|nr:hypothetical protein [Limisphaerales bacterium]MCS1413363.1 hypothetical protein [Limisphaerales bacterium]
MKAWILGGGVSLLKGGVEAGLGLLFPEVCQICRAQLAKAGDGFVCAACWQRFRFVRDPFCDCCGLPFEGEVTSTFRCGNCKGRRFAFRAARAAVVANEFSLEIIHRYKYSGEVWFEGLLSNLLWDQLGVLGLRWGWDLVVPVPLFATKQREREFNQAERIGKTIADRLEVPLAVDLVKRVVPTGSQTMLSRAERLDNVRGAFVAGRRTNLRGKCVMVVDDVFTTGATSNACAQVLRRMSAGEIWVCTVVRGL